VTDPILGGVRAIGDGSRLNLRPARSLTVVGRSCRRPTSSIAEGKHVDRSRTCAPLLAAGLARKAGIAEAVAGGDADLGVPSLTGTTSLPDAHGRLGAPGSGW
jgi:hypothetical protein